eukprot:NODE_5_length_49639_cov_0.484336.p15 type:complete len:285 gc:universal NODE_5_length_49639_cov_0.484336:328-1182(+)
MQFNMSQVSFTTHTIETNNKKIEIQFRESDGYVNATKLCKDFKKRWYNFYRSAETKKILDSISEFREIQLVENLNSNSRSNFSGPFLIYLGGHGIDTFAHPDISVELVRWLDTSFAYFMNQLVQRFLSGNLTTEESLKAREQLKFVVTPCEQARHDAIEMNKLKTLMVKTRVQGATHKEYAQLNDSANRGVLKFKGTTAQFKKENGLQRHHSVPSVMNYVASSRCALINMAQSCGLSQGLTFKEVLKKESDFSTGAEYLFSGKADTLDYVEYCERRHTRSVSIV